MAGTDQRGQVDVAIDTRGVFKRARTGPEHPRAPAEALVKALIVDALPTDTTTSCEVASHSLKGMRQTAQSSETLAHPAVALKRPVAGFRLP